MKKIMILIGICTILVASPLISATTIKNLQSQHQSDSPIAMDEEYDGTFIGGIGQIYKEGKEWTYDTHAYLAGLYKGGRVTKLYGQLFDLDQQQIGSIVAFVGRHILIGRISNLDDQKLPIVGLLFNNEDKFLGRIMSLFGPAPHIWGEFSPA